jgi:hypothetical protein
VVEGACGEEAFGDSSESRPGGCDGGRVHDGLVCRGGKLAETGTLLVSLPSQAIAILGIGEGAKEKGGRDVVGEERITFDSSGTWENATMNTAAVASSGTINIAGFHARSSGFPMTVWD